MRTYKPHGRYDFVCDITATIFGTTDKTVTLFSDFECEVDVEVDLSGDGFSLDATCTDVLIGGQSLRHGDDQAQLIRLQVMERADEELAEGGPLFEEVRDAEGLALTGHPNDPDTHWRQEAW